MRELADSDRIERFMRALGRAADADGACYFAGGATAVLFGWRESTIDVDVLLVPETEALLRAVKQLKDEIQINVELASPVDFIPIPPGWEDRSIFVAREGRLSFFHIELLAQALAKLERAHAQDLDDIAAMLERGLVDRDAAFVYFEQIEPELYRFPAIDPATFRARAEETFSQMAR